MKEIQIAGKLECNFNTQLQRHMDNVGCKLNDLADAIKLARNEGYNLTVDISKLEIEEVKKRKSPRITIKIHGDLNMDKLVRLFKIANGHSSY